MVIRWLVSRQKEALWPRYPTLPLRVEMGHPLFVTFLVTLCAYGFLGLQGGGFAG